MKQNVGGLVFTLRPKEQIQLRNSDYILCNKSPVTIRLHLFLKSKAEAIVALADDHNDQKGKSNVHNY